MFFMFLDLKNAIKEDLKIDLQLTLGEKDK